MTARKKSAGIAVLEADENGASFSSEHAPAIKVVLAADRSDMATRVAEMRWRQWGTGPVRGKLSWWIEDAIHDVGRTEMPVGFIAVDDHDRVLGAVSLRPVDRDELRDRGPWVQGTIVRSDQRARGVGQLLMQGLEKWAVDHGIQQAWVCNEGPAVAFYESCGWVVQSGNACLNTGETVTVLTKTLPSAT